ncbi:MAG TPA: CHAT domain-containing protein, partial [Pirellulaceae bacterium]|nr:CHAT domain-containing protein [Pirellulaceae bacterium]
ARSEILAVRDSFERAFPATDAVTVLRQAHASEARIRQECSRHPFIHIVTHGFVAESTPAPLAPGLSAGLALAGANEPGDDPLDDGILSAAEFADLDLRAAELVVLSACESGLGPIAAGEGVLGLQRACQMAGAKTVVASLWRVNDRATQQLMEMYYERVCATADPISRIEALRQAQLAMLRGGGQRGLGIVSRAPARATERRAPYEWAAFVLGGDWR